MPHKCAEEVPQTRNGKSNTAETDSKKQHSQSGTKREDGRGHKKSREGLFIVLTITDR